MENIKKEIQTLVNLYRSQQLYKAEELNNKLLKVYPKVVILYNILGLILTSQKRLDEAIQSYEKGISIDPGSAEIYDNLGTVYKMQTNYVKAENYYKKSIDLNSTIPEPQNNLANLYITLNREQEGIDCYKKAINIKPNFFIAHYNLAVAYKNIGKFEEAKKYLNESIKLNPHFFTAHRTLSQLTKYESNNEHFDLLKKLYKDPKDTNMQKTELLFALGKASEDIRDFGNAFRYYTEGNELRRKEIIFSIQQEKDEFKNIKKVFNSNIFDKFKKFGNFDQTPIFILGMPRSGSTLVEQILSTHSAVFGGDELNFFADLIDKYFNNKSKGFLSNNIININKDNLKKIGQEYIDYLKKISNNSEKVTDKLPINFKWIGFIKLLLPNSTIIHCTRNPKGNCLSIFKNYFASRKLNFAYSLDEIVEFYNLYNDLMKYWSNLLPNFITTIKYEKIVENPEKEIRNLIKVCNLSWEDKCLKFYDNKRPIKTASNIQARKKIYKSAIDSWKNYESYLKDFFSKIGKIN